MKDLQTISGWLWSTPMVLLVLGIGTVFTVWMRVPQIRRIPDMLSQLKSGGGSDRGISSFESLAMALGGRVGVGNIAGVAAAIGVGGPGAMFWMWLTAIVGAAVAVVESSLAQVWKEEVEGEYRGGPAYYIEKGLNAKWLALAYAVATILATTITGPTIQANSIAVSAKEAFAIDPRITGLFVATLFCLVVFGGMKRIGRVCGLMVPFMAIAYVLVGIVVLVVNAEHVPAMFRLIFESAFGMDSMFGGMLGAAILWGVRRAVYSSEAGTGSGAQASAAAEVSHPVKQGLAQGFSVYVDTLVVCTITGLMILVTNSYNVLAEDHSAVVQYLPGVDAGPAFTQNAIETVAPGFGAAFVAIAMFFFAFTTLLSFGFYADTNIAYILRSHRHERTIIRVFQVVLAASILVGSFRKSDFAWSLADVGLGLYTWINLVALIPLVPVAIRVFRDYERQRKAGEDPVFRPENVGVTNAPLWDSIADHYERTGEALPAADSPMKDHQR
ncbi:alanine/glycine:cation symporter family protein [Mobilicoccus pelagius]|uniref:Putative sodium/alanine symporter n=1 Tax=Mobilicoccus pelagius NBRC 104925 TaxID=1089455 RepID=H5UNC7_9MICO|nr:alanine/glycine:cation symporter family protein [Mobilicoccus pelagius]GAB47235.1 putative sodium/alanine symporter [Mobilicoccus pelagius NBRC 104925]